MKTVDSFNFKGKKALIRVDFNVPLNEKYEITDDNRIKAALPTIRKILQDGGSTILMSHLGRPKEGPTEKYSLKHLVKHLSGELGVNVQFANDCVGKEAIDKAKDNIREGESIAGPLKKSGQFPPIVIHMINVGEKTGELETMLNQVSDSYDFQVKNEVDGLTSLLEPVMLIMMGGVIAVVVFSIIVPMFEMQNFAG